MTLFEVGLLALWDRLRAVREPHARWQYEVIRAEIRALGPLARGLTTSRHGDDVRAVMLYEYLLATSESMLDGQLRASLADHAVLEARLLDIFDQIRNAHDPQTFVTAAFALMDIHGACVALEPASPARWAYARLYGYLARLRASEELRFEDQNAPQSSHGGALQTAQSREQ